MPSLSSMISICSFSPLLYLTINSNCGLLKSYSCFLKFLNQPLQLANPDLYERKTTLPCRVKDLTHWPRQKMIDKLPAQLEAQTARFLHFSPTYLCLRIGNQRFPTH